MREFNSKLFVCFEFLRLKTATNLKALTSFSSEPFFYLYLKKYFKIFKEEFITENSYREDKEE